MKTAAAEPKAGACPAPSCSIIILTLNAAGSLPTLLDRIFRQTLRPAEVLVVDSGSGDGTVALARKYSGVRCIQVEKTSFDHGGTRDMALRQTKGDIVCFLTQDALPVNERYLEELTAPLINPAVACACGRQEALKSAPLAERLTRAFNYPERSFIRSSEDLVRMGIKTYFLSDVCSAYRRDAYLAVGGFANPILVNEDMLIASRMIRRGYRIAYCAEARVWHSHTYTLSQEFRRNFDIGAFLAMYVRELPGAGTAREGLRYIRAVSARLLAKGHVISWLTFCAHCTARLLGNLFGKKYQQLPRRWILRMSAQQAYWRNSDRFT
ncbi:MAG: glycosyltransferase [Clostridia bacterium]|nr:glycosyltransferase [Clostridia bacterium]